MYAVAALIGLMLLTWGAAIWASFADEPGKEARALRFGMKRAA